MRSLFAVMVTAAALLASAQARAQSPYSASVYSEGPGFRLGHAPLTIHPGLATEIGYDSNVFYAPQAVGSGLLRLRAHVDLATLPPQSFENDPGTADPKLDFRVSTQLEYREYLSTDPNVTAQRSINFTIAPGLTLFPRGPLTFKLLDDFTRTVDPSNLETPGNFTRDANRVSLFGAFHHSPTGLEFGLGDSFGVNFWETTALHYGNFYSNEAQALLNWWFRARNHLSLVARVGYFHYTDDPALDSIPLRITTGLTMVLAPWFGFLAQIGYGNSFSSTGPSFNSAIARGELRFQAPHLIRVTAGYDRDFQNTAYASWYVDDMFFLSYEQPLVHRLSTRVQGDIRLRNYGPLAAPAAVNATGYSSPNRTDPIYEAQAELNVRALSWLSFGASYSLLINDSDFFFISGTAQTRVSFVKHSALARVDVAY